MVALDRAIGIRQKQATQGSKTGGAIFGKKTEQITDEIKIGNDLIGLIPRHLLLCSPRICLLKSKKTSALIECHTRYILIQPRHLGVGIYRMISSCGADVGGEL
jgi:hypothetical protein